MKQSKLFIPIFVVIILLCSVLVFSSEITTFTNLLTSENITLDSGVNTIRYLHLPFYSVLNNASMNIKSYYLNTSSYCYQEFANYKTCYHNNISSGYDYTNNWTFTTFGTDGIYDTQSSSCSCLGSCRNADLYINYTIPPTQNETIWQVSYGKISDMLLNNFTIDSSCLNDDILNLKFHSNCIVADNYVSGYCYNGSTWILVFTKAGSSYTSLYEESIYWDINESVSNLNISIGNLSNSTYGKFDNISLNFYELLNNSFKNCVMDSENYCDLALNFKSDVNGVLEYSNLSVDYSINPSTLSVNVYDSTTLNKITNTEVTVQLIGSVFQLENHTITGQSNFSFPFNTSVADDITVRAYSRNNTDYSIVINNITLTPGVDKTLDLYLTNTSNLATTNLVTFYVYDEDYSTLEGATIHIELQNPSTNNYLPITSLTTKSNGQATTILATDTFFYRWYVDYKGKEIYRLNAPVSLSLIDDLIYIVGVIEEKYSDEVTQILDNYVDLHFNTTSNITGFFEVDYNMVDPVEMCIYVYIHNQSGTYLNTTSCENATFGTLQTGILTPSNRTYYVSFAKVDFKDGEGYIIMDTSDEFLGRDGKVLTKSQGLFILIILTLASVMGFIASPIIGLIIFMVGVIGISLMPFIVGFKIGTAMIMVSLALITAVTISRLKK